MKKLLKEKRPFVFWIAMSAHVLILLAWIMQAYSLIDWGNAVALGLQENSFNSNDVDIALAGISKGLAIADMVYALPLSIIGIIGFLKGRFYGYIASIMLYAICIYFPLFFAFQKWESNMETVLIAIILWLVPSAIATFSLVIKRDYFMKSYINKKENINEYI